MHTYNRLLEDCDKPHITQENPWVRSRSQNSNKNTNKHRGTAYEL